MREYDFKKYITIKKYNMIYLNLVKRSAFMYSTEKFTKEISCNIETAYLEIPKTYKSPNFSTHKCSLQ